MRFVLLIVCLLAIAGAPRAEDWKTDYERSNYLRTPDYAATVAYCERLAAASPWVHYATYGTSPQGRALPLLIIDRNGNFTSDTVRQTDNVVFLIQAGIHSGEIDGKDAGLMLIREMVITRELETLLDHVTVLFMPIFNVDGHERTSPYSRVNQNGPAEMGWRTTAQNLNLNRDYLKAATPEMQAWLKLYVEWLPEFFADCHVTDGADYQYAVTYALELFDNMEAGLVTWTRDRYLAPLKKAMAKSKFPIERYANFRTDHDPRSGLTSWAAPPRFSEGYTAIQNRPGLLIETHMLKDYRTRVTGTYEMLRHSLVILNAEHTALREACRAADAITASATFRSTPYPMKFALGPDSAMIDFLGYDYTAETSDLTGGVWYRYSDKPVSMRIPYFHTQVATASVSLPDVYVLPQEWSAVIQRLALHGVTLDRITQDVTLEVETYRITNPTWAAAPYEGAHPLTCTPVAFRETRTLRTGDVVVDMNQRAAHILEPIGPDSYLYWGFFHAVMEQKEYIESYVAEELARKMLKEQPELRAEFDAWRAGNPEHTPIAAQHWFYTRSPYWDQKMGVYPVSRISGQANAARILQAAGR